MKRWSKLKKQIENLLFPDIQVHFTVNRMKSQRGNTNLPRFYITSGKGKSREVLFDYPSDKGGYYPYDVPDFSSLLREYIDTPLKELRYKKFESDTFGVCSCLKNLDRRLNYRRVTLTDRVSG